MVGVVHEDVEMAGNRNVGPLSERDVECSAVHSDLVARRDE
jgi:hypothetical protein